MKKILTSILAVAAIVASFAACQKEDEVKTFSADVTVSANFDEGVPSPASYSVVLKNTSTSQEFTAQTVESVAKFTNLMSGVYNVTVTATVSAGTTVYNIAGAKDGVSITADSKIEVTVTASAEKALLFKEIYTSGVTVQTPEEAGDDYGVTYFRDQFYEIYNNSTEIQYADGLCISICEHYNYDFSMKYEYEAPLNYNDYVFVTTVWQIPGNGTDYPIKPGESIVVAQWATDHTAANLTSGKSKANLTGAEFEAIEGESEVYGGITITDGPSINMSRVVLSGYSMPQWLTAVSGCGYLLFKPEGTMRNDNFNVPTNYSYTKTLEIPISWVIDAVERCGDATRFDTPQLPASLNTGMIHLSAPGQYTGESIARKIAETRADGTVKYQNTKNTANDFEVKTTPEIRRNNAGVPSWNTWAN